MSDYQNPAGGIDAALDGAFAALDQAYENREAVIEDGDDYRERPTALSTTGLWENAKQLHADKKAAKEAKAKADKAEKGDKDEKLSKAEIHARRVKERDEGLDASLDKATAKSSEAQKKGQDERAGQAKGEKPKPLSTKAFNDPETVKHRKELVERVTGKKLSERLADFEKWDAAFKKDPVGTREQIMNAYLKFSPNPTRAAKKGEEGIGGAVDSAIEGADALADIKDFADKHGERVPELLRRLNEYEKDLVADPVGASARIAALYGAADAPAQQPAQQQATQPHQLSPPASPQEDYSRVSQGLDMAIKHNVLPGLQNDEIAEAVAMVLSHMPRTPDRFADLQKAYGIVVGQSAPTVAAPAAARSTAGQKSIHGSPATSGGGRRSNGGDGLDQALNRAFGR